MDITPPLEVPPVSSEVPSFLSDAPPSDVPPSDVPPSDVPPFDVPLSDVPSSGVPPSFEEREDEHSPPPDESKKWLVSIPVHYESDSLNLKMLILNPCASAFVVV